MNEEKELIQQIISKRNEINKLFEEATEFGIRIECKSDLSNFGKGPLAHLSIKFYKELTPDA